MARPKIDPITSLTHKVDRLLNTVDSMARQLNALSIRVGRGNMNIRELTESVDTMSEASEAVTQQVITLTESTNAVTETLDKIAAEVVPDITAAGIEFYINNDGKLEKVEDMNMKAEQTLNLAIQIKDAKGNPALVDGAPVWSVTDQSLGAVVAADDGMSAVFTPAGPLGTCQVHVSADADLGEGVKELIGDLDVNIVAGDAVSIELSGEVV